MLDPKLETAFRTAAATLRDNNGKPPSMERVDQMLRQFERNKQAGKPDDLNYIESIGAGWK